VTFFATKSLRFQSILTILAFHGLLRTSRASPIATSIETIPELASEAEPVFMARLLY
jgi:hypothetical protein